MELQNKYEINDVVISFDDFKAFSTMTKISKIVKVWKGIGIAYISLFVIVSSILLKFGESHGTKLELQKIFNLDFIPGISGFFIMIFILFIFPWLIYPGIANKAFRKAFENNKFIQRPQNFLFDDIGFKVVTLNGENSFKWEEIVDVKETKSYLALSISKYYTFIIPRKFLENRNDVLKLIRSKTISKYAVVKGGLGID